jgi:hypothetical protein
MNLSIIYIITALTAVAIGRMQRKALHRRNASMLAIIFFMRIVLMLLAGIAVLFLHLSPLHLILNIILFWIISLIAFQ